MPQGAVISPLLANLLLHYAFDRWMAEQCSAIGCHCVSEAQAHALRDVLGQRLMQWHLEFHPHKTKIVYCKVANRRDSYPEYRFDFLSYTFAHVRRRIVWESYSSVSHRRSGRKQPKRCVSASVAGGCIIVTISV